MRTVGYIPESKSSVFICPVCNKEYKREADLKKHVEKEHPDYKPASGADV